MRIKAGIFVMATVMGIAVPCAAQISLPIHLLPVVAKLEGAADTDWVSSVTVSNVGELEADVTALFFREERNNTPIFGPTHVFSLEAGETVTAEDVLGDWFPGQGDTKGFLLILGDAVGGGEQDQAVLAVKGRIFNNADPSATYGQTVPSSMLGLVVAPGHANLAGARSDPLVRSNVGVMNLGLAPLDLIISTYAADGSMLAAVRKSVRVFSLGQWSLGQLGVPELSTPGRVEVMVDPDSITWDPCFGDDPGLEDIRGIFLAYMSLVDGVTGDAEFVLGQNDWREYVELCGEPSRLLPRQLLLGPR
jgi:hypothetical protein